MLQIRRYGLFISKNGAGPSGPAPFLLPHSHCVASAWRAARVRSGRPQGRCVVRRTGSGRQQSAGGGLERRERRLKQRKRSNRLVLAGRGGSARPRLVRPQPAPPRGGYPNNGRHRPSICSLREPASRSVGLNSGNRAETVQNRSIRLYPLPSPWGAKIRGENLRETVKPF